MFPNKLPRSLDFIFGVLQIIALPIFLFMGGRSLTGAGEPGSVPPFQHRLNRHPASQAKCGLRQCAVLVPGSPISQPVSSRKYYPGASISSRRNSSTAPRTTARRARFLSSLVAKQSHQSPIRIKQVGKLHRLPWRYRPPQKNIGSVTCPNF